MSFAIGHYYECVDNTSGPYSSVPLSKGTFYQVHDIDLAADTILVKDDLGRDFWVGARRFNSAGRPASTPYYSSPKNKPRSLGAHGRPLCSCGCESEKKEFSTFSYFYCAPCKAEVNADGGKVGDTLALSVSTLPVTPALPSGVLALKGESVVCNNCNAFSFYLPEDLSENKASATSVYRAFLGSMPHIFGQCPSCGDRDNGITVNHTGVNFFVLGRGWV